MAIGFWRLTGQYAVDAVREFFAPLTWLYNLTRPVSRSNRVVAKVTKVRLKIPDEIRNAVEEHTCYQLAYSIRLRQQELDLEIERLRAELIKSSAATPQSRAAIDKTILRLRRANVLISYNIGGARTFTGQPVQNQS